jgi:hypothetical protein
MTIESVDFIGNTGCLTIAFQPRRRLIALAAVG